MGLKTKLTSDKLSPNPAHGLPKPWEERKEAWDVKGNQTLVDRAEFQRLHGTPTASVIRWVSLNLVLDGVKPSDAPDPAAWGLLQWARTNGATRQSFWKDLYMKLVPKDTVLDAQAKQEDDGRALLHIIDHIKGQNYEDDD